MYLTAILEQGAADEHSSLDGLDLYNQGKPKPLALGKIQDEVFQGQSA